MPSPDDRIVRVFISSTFRDMHAERDHLVTVVFPELRERCERLGQEFVDVDLRWGVPEKTLNEDQMEQANSWEYCRKRIDQVQPFFLCMLGHRYGWVPEPEKLKSDADKAAQAQDARSITHMEVHHAVLSTSLKHRSYFYLRSTEAPPTATDFIETDPLSIPKLEALKTAIGLCGRPVRHYQPKWRDDHFIEFEAFGKAVLEDLWSGVLRDERYVSKEAWQRVLGHAPDADPLYTDDSQPLSKELWERLVTEAKPEPKTPLEAEREGMERFAESRLKFFQGRTRELNDLLQFIHDPAPESRLALLAAQPGQGKSALMAKLWETLEGRALAPASAAEAGGELGPPSAASNARRVEDNAPYLTCHFVGATSNFSSSYHLVRRLNDELEASGIAFPEPPTPEGQPKEEPKLDFQSLCQRLWTRLGDYDGERRIVILLDALNQLDDGHDLGWLPYRLGPNVRVVVSCIEEEEVGRKMEGKKNSENVSTPNLSTNEPTAPGKVLTALDARHPQPRRISLGKLAPEDVRQIVKDYLDEYGKELDAEHVATICDEQKLPQARNPLYLLVMLAELRTLGGNDMNQRVPELIARMSADHPDTVSLFHWMLERLEQAEGFGKEAVQAWCLYLALGRVGMASRELSDLLKRKLGDKAAATAQRIERALRRYLQRRGEQWDFFHGQFRQAVMERCTHSGKWPAQSLERNQEVSETIRQAHRDIANYFRALADPLGDQTWKGENLRAFNETAPHLIGAKQWDDLCAYLTDFRCLDRRVQAGQVFDIVRNHKAALTTLPEFAMEAQQEQERIRICAEYGAALIAYCRDRGKDKHTPLPHPPVATDVRDDSEAENCCTRATKLKVIANVMALHSTFTAALPQFFLSWIANAVADGPLIDAGVVLDTDGIPWLRRAPRPPAPPLRPQCVQILRGHTDHVRSVALSADGSRAVSGGRDNTLRFWDLTSGKCLRTIPGQMGYSVTSVALSADASCAISGSDDELMRVWNLVGGQCLQTLRGHTDKVTCVALTADGSRAISGSGDRTLRLWDLVTGRCLQTLQGHEWPVISVALSADGSRAVSGSDDLSVRVWNLITARCIQVFRNHAGFVFSVAMTPDGSRAISGSGDLTLRIWDLMSGHCPQPYRHHEGSVTSVALSTDGSCAISGGDDQLLRIWNPASGQCLQTFRGHTDKVTHVSLSTDGSRAISVSNDNCLHVWNLANGQCLHVLRFYTDQITEVAGAVRSVAISADGARAVAGSFDGILRVWDLASGQCLQTLQGRTGYGVTSVALPLDGFRVISANGSPILHIWDLVSGKCLQTLTLNGHTRCVTSVAFSIDGSRAVSGGGYSDETVRAWDLTNGECLHIFQGHTLEVSSVALSIDASVVVSGSLDKTVRVWDLNSGVCLAIYHAGATVESVSISTKGDRIVCGTSDGQMHFLTPRNFPPLA